MNIIKKLLFLIFKPKSWFKSFWENNKIWFFNWFQKPQNISIWNHNFMYYWNMFLAWDNKINIWNGCHFAMNILLITYSHAFNLPDIESIPYDKRLIWRDIVIKDWVWIWTRVVILPWVTVWKWAIIAAGAIVSKSIPDYEIWWGNPAKKISIRKNIEQFEKLLKEWKFRRKLKYKNEQK